MQPPSLTQQAIPYGRGIYLTGRSRRILRKLQYDLGTERVVAAMRASGVASLESVADVLRIMHEHEYFRCASDMDHRAWELLPALLAPSLKRSSAGGKSSQEQAAQTASIEQESEECVTSLTSFTEYQTASQQQQQQHESNGEARSKKSLRRCPSLQWTGEALWAEPADAGGCSHASVEEVLGDLMARTRTLGFEALLGPLRVRWTVPRATTFLASWLGELEETCGLHDVGIGFDYKRIPLCASRLLAHAGVRRTPAGLNAVVAQVAAAMANCGVAATEDVVGALYASLLMLLRRPREEDQQGNDATGAPLDWAGVGAVLAALEEHFDDCFDMQEVHRYYAGVSLAEFLGHTCRGGPAAFYQATTTLILGYTSRLCRLQPKSSARMHVVARIVSAVSALGLDSVRVLPRAQTAAEATAAGQEGVHAAAAALAAEERVVVSIADSQPMVALAYCLPAAGLLTAGEVGSLLSALAPHARWLPTEAAFLAAEIRKWPLRRAAASAAGSGTNANCVSDSTLGGLFRRGQEEEEEEMESENEERGVASDDEAQSGVARSLTAEAAHSAAAAESGDRASAPPAKRRRVAAPEVAMAAAEGVPLVGNGGDNLAAMMMSLCGPATAWDSRWLHAVIQLLWREGWSWAELGEFSSELLRGEPAEPRR